MLPKINRRGFFALILTALLPKEQLEGWSVDLGRPADCIPAGPLANIGGEDMLDDLTLTTLAYMRGMPEVWDMDVAPIWSGEIFPTYGSISRNALSARNVQTKENE